jgi:hypothetical protein
MDIASIAVWDVPLPAVAGTNFVIKVGVKSQSGVALAGTRVEVFDHTGNVVATGSLGDAPWLGTEALYWTELQVPAPAAGQAEEFAVTCNGAVSRFGVAAMPKPECRLTVKAADQGSAAPLADVEVRLGPFHARTDAKGLAVLNVCKGTYELQVWRNGYLAPPTPIEIAGDHSVEVAMLHVPEEHPDARWVR